MASSEAAKAASRRHYRLHRLSIAATLKQKCIDNPEFLEGRRKRKRKWAKDNPDSQAKRLRERRRKAFRILGGVCRFCGFSDVRALQIDHARGGGSVERRCRGNVWATYDVLRHPKLYQLLCANCNWIKRVENGESGSRL